MPVRKFQIDHQAFSKYTPESVYWAGFLAADGNIRITSSNCKQIRLYLKKSDSSHLEKFKKFLKSEHKVSLSPSYDRCSFEVTSSQIYDDLIKFYKLTPTKSFTLQPPVDIPEDMVHHFIRGIFDGDGTIGETFTCKNSLMATIFFAITGTEPIINFIFNWAESKLGQINYKVVNHPVSVGIKIFNLSTNKTLELMPILYNGSTDETRLDRKYEISNNLVKGIRKTRELPPYDQRMTCTTSRRRGVITSTVGLSKLRKSQVLNKDDGIV